MAIGHSTRTDEVYFYIRQKIIAGEVEFGSRLHTTNLTNETGFSNTPIREALVKLEMDGLAQSIPHKGVFVARPGRHDFEEMLESRLCLELFTAPKVMEKASPRGIREMRQASRSAMLADLSDDMAFEKGFHGHYFHTAGNSYMAQLYSRSMSLLSVLYIRSLQMHGDNRWIKTQRESHYDEEQKIIDAIEQGDLVLLENTIKSHIRKFGTDLLESLQDYPPGGLTWSS